MNLSRGQPSSQFSRHVSARAISERVELACGLRRQAAGQRFPGDLGWREGGQRYGRSQLCTLLARCAGLPSLEYAGIGVMTGLHFSPPSLARSIPPAELDTTRPRRPRPCHVTRLAGIAPGALNQGQVPSASHNGRTSESLDPMLFGPGPPTGATSHDEHITTNTAGHVGLGKRSVTGRLAGCPHGPLWRAGW